MADTTNTTTFDATPTNPSTEAQPRAHNKLAELRRIEKFWTWKFALRVTICLLDIIGIGCAAYFVAIHLDITNSNMNYYDNDGLPGASVGGLIALCLSFTWCLLAIVIPFFLKPTRPVHPGVPVGIDLILWLIFIVVGLFCVGIAISAISFGSDPNYLQDPGYYNHGYSGNYYLAPNNTWVYNITYVSDGNNNGYYYNYTTESWEPGTISTANVTRDCTPLFTTCAQQDAYINQLWHEKPKKEALGVLLDAILWLDMFLHFVLFVWACVDTHKYNREKRPRAEHIVADRIIRDLEAKGLIAVHNGVVVPVNQVQSHPHTGQYYDPEFQSNNPVYQQPQATQQRQESPMTQVAPPGQASVPDKAKGRESNGVAGPSINS